MRTPNKILLRWCLAFSLATAETAHGHGTNPLHLDVSVRNPFETTAVMTSVAPTHHTFADKFPGAQSRADLSMDVGLSGGSAGHTIFFLVDAPMPGVEVRGQIVNGGAGRAVLACNPPKHAGYKLLVEVQAKPQDGDWIPIGWITYAHLVPATVENGAVVNQGDPVGVISADYDGNVNCSTHPHVHLEYYDYNHYAGFVYREEYSSLPVDGAIACLGGARPPLSVCGSSAALGNFALISSSISGSGFGPHDFYVTWSAATGAEIYDVLEWYYPLGPYDYPGLIKSGMPLGTPTVLGSVAADQERRFDWHKDSVIAGTYYIKIRARGDHSVNYDTYGPYGFSFEP